MSAGLVRARLLRHGKRDGSLGLAIPGRGGICMLKGGNDPGNERGRSNVLVWKTKS